ncbi:NepR family anti-sigma factor [Marinibacterium sp. SX1]|uniref:NepR family anti-sigma factor n=1 Tax=Marinibacterium sp. SX1 TaxID=3388424 RepID=UPI003D16E1C7
MTEKDRASKLEQMIDANLKRAFDDVLNEDIPDRFTNLLAELRAADTPESGETDTQAQKVGGARNGG